MGIFKKKTNNIKVDNETYYGLELQEDDSDYLNKNQIAKIALDRDDKRYRHWKSFCETFNYKTTEVVYENREFYKSNKVLLIVNTMTITRLEDGEIGVNIHMKQFMRDNTVIESSMDVILYNMSDLSRLGFNHEYKFVSAKRNEEDKLKKSN